MSNSLFNSFNQPPQTNNNFISEFNKFRSAFTGNPQEQVMRLLTNGQMSQEQFNKFAQTANQLRSLIK